MTGATGGGAPLHHCNNESTILEKFESSRFETWIDCNLGLSNFSKLFCRKFRGRGLSSLTQRVSMPIDTSLSQIIHRKSTMALDQGQSCRYWPSALSSHDHWCPGRSCHSAPPKPPVVLWLLGRVFLSIASCDVLMQLNFWCHSKLVQYLYVRILYSILYTYCRYMKIIPTNLFKP